MALRMPDGGAAGTTAADPEEAEADESEVPLRLFLLLDALNSMDLTSVRLTMI